jgi:hypothetical protein
MTPKKNEFQVGDRVRVRYWGDMLSEYGRAETVYQTAIEVPFLFTHEMKHLCGQVFHVIRIDESKYRGHSADSIVLADPDNSNKIIKYLFSAEMLQKAHIKDMVLEDNVVLKDKLQNIFTPGNKFTEEIL